MGHYARIGGNGNLKDDGDNEIKFPRQLGDPLVGSEAWGRIQEWQSTHPVTGACEIVYRPPFAGVVDRLAENAPRLIPAALSVRIILSTEVQLDTPGSKPHKLPVMYAETIDLPDGESWSEWADRGVFMLSAFADKLCSGKFQETPLDWRAEEIKPLVVPSRRP